MPELSRDKSHEITFTLNGREVRGRCEPRMLLSDFLRKVMAMNGVHVGCEHGVCGACTVRVNGRPARACLMFAVQVGGQDVETVEALAGPDENLSILQEAFKRHHGLQCGYCTPGILMSAGAFLKQNPSPSSEEVRDMLSGHICRCTGYVGMVRAILDAAAQLRDKAET